MAVRMPNSVTDIEDNAFMGDDNLSIYCYENSYAEGYAAEKTIRCYLLDTPFTKADFLLPDKLKTIETESFRGSRAKRVKLNESVEKIGSQAFSDCPDLIQIYIPSSCTSIASNAFSNMDVTIFGELDSYAATYAKDNGFSFAGAQSSISYRIRLYMLSYTERYDACLDINKDGTITSMDYIVAQKAGL